MFVRFCQMAASKAERFSVGVKHCWPGSGEREGDREKPCTSKAGGWELQPNHLSFSSAYKESTSPRSIQELKRNKVCCNIVPGKTKGYWSHSSRWNTLTLRLQLACRKLRVHAKAYETAKRHKVSRKHRINIHQGSENEGVIRWLSESDRSRSSSIVCPKKESHAETQEAQKARAAAWGKVS